MCLEKGRCKNVREVQKDCMKYNKCMIYKRDLYHESKRKSFQKHAKGNISAPSAGKGYNSFRLFKILLIRFARLHPKK